MKSSSYTKKVFVIKKQSKPLVDFVNKLRENKQTSQEELQKKASFYFTNSYK